MNRIVPCLWYANEALEAAQFYCEAIPNSKIISDTTFEGTPSGTAQLVEFDLNENRLIALGAGPGVDFTPASSLMVICRSADDVDAVWSNLSDGAETLMELDAYPFSDRYGWLQDKFGLSWQVIFLAGQADNHLIVPSLMFTGNVYGKAKEAIVFYTSLFSDSQINELEQYGTCEEPDVEGAVKYASFSLSGQQFAAMESAYDHGFGFSEAFSLMVMCQDQEEIDYYWEALSSRPESEMCGWLKDKFGVSWQITPQVVFEMYNSGDARQRKRVLDAVIQMKKIEISQLRRAFEGV